MVYKFLFVVAFWYARFSIHGFDPNYVVLISYYNVVIG